MIAVGSNRSLVPHRLWDLAVQDHHAQDGFDVLILNSEEGRTTGLPSPSRMRHVARVCPASYRGLYRHCERAESDLQNGRHGGNRFGYVPGLKCQVCPRPFTRPSSRAFCCPRCHSEGPISLTLEHPNFTSMCALHRPPDLHQSCTKMHPSKERELLPGIRSVQPSAPLESVPSACPETLPIAH